jgi:hypothetical protein
MKSFKFLPIAAIFGCYVFSSVAIAQQVCPVGGGACTARTLPASSYSNARAVDVMIRPPVPVLPTPEALALQIAPLLPPSSGPSGIFCGRAAVYTDSMGVTERSPCQGHLVAYQAPTSVYVPESGGQCAENGQCDPIIPAYWGTSYVFTSDCPIGYGFISTGSSGPYQYFSCIKS